MISAVIQKLIRSPAGPYLLLLLTAMATLFFRLGTLPFLGADEPRYARIAEEMNQAGRWVTPLLQGHPWLEKPPLYYWLTIVSYRLSGVSEATARIGSAMCAVLACAAIIWLGTRLWSRRAGLLGGLILISTIGFSAFGRSASPDMPFTACCTLVFSLLALAAARDALKPWQVICAYVFLGLAVLAKGPVALVLAAGILLGFWVLDERGGCLGRMRAGWGALIAVLVAFPWFWLSFRENGYSFISIFFINHHLARYVTDLHHHEQAFYYFLPILLGLFFPWTGWLPALLRFPLRWPAATWRTWDRGAVFLACWTLFPILFFSLSTSKLPGYVLPSLPPLALLLGRSLSEAIGKPEGNSALKTARWACLAASLGVAVALPIVLQTSFGTAYQTGLAMSAAVLVPAIVAFDLGRRLRYRGAFWATTVQGVVLVLATTQLVFPALAEYHSTRDIARQALAASSGGEPIATYGYFHQTLHYYTGYRISANLVDLPSLAEYARAQSRLLVVTDADRIPEIETLPGLSIALIGRQGNVRLLRITPRVP